MIHPVCLLAAALCSAGTHMLVKKEGGLHGALAQQNVDQNCHHLIVCRSPLTVVCLFEKRKNSKPSSLVDRRPLNVTTHPASSLSSFSL